MGSSHSTRKITLVNDDKAGVIKLSESLAYRLRGQIEGQQATAAAAAAEPPPSPSPAPPPVPTIPKVPETPKVPQVAPEPFIPEPILAPPPPPEPAPGPPPEPALAPVFVPEPAPAPFFVPESPRVEASGPGDTTPEKLISTTSPSVPEVAKTAAAAVDLPEKAATEPLPDVGVAVRAGSAPALSQPGGNIPPWSIYAEEAHLMVMRLREEKEQELQQLNRDWREKMDAREQEFSKMSQLSEEEVNTAVKDVEKLFVKASCSPVCQDYQESVMTCYQDHPRQALRCARQVEEFARCVDLSRLQSVLRQRAN
ncbi:SH3 domain-containing protein C23A1.17-like isoform X1 [Portunus trituberculatus]|uniref:SH3 domain-containing protein C23A1.17-like isoform X1 n=1 Tax=Portunus trituberculatus TaxID=210409 RepID=UPI001E1CDF02|nr:SH3 domain-containing protein C23A1.17-like isoform X1 [Portunus trituberculatus]